MGRQRGLASRASQLTRAQPGAYRPLEAQLPELVGAPPDSDDFLHETKFDGFRCLADVVDGRVTLRSRHGTSWTATLPAIKEAVAALGLTSARLDGELVCADAAGRSSLGLLQSSMRARRPSGISLVLFDLTFVDGVNLQGTPTIERKELLAEVLARGSGELLRYSSHVIGHGQAAFAAAYAAQVEGVVSKRINAGYRAGRSRDWCKAKTFVVSELSVVGFEPSRGRGVAAVLVAARDGKSLRYVGRVEYGLSNQARLALRGRLDLHRCEAPQCESLSRPNALTVWVAPAVSVRVRHLGFEHGLVRHASLVQ